MHTPIPFFLRHRWFVVLAVLALCAGGLLAWFRLPIDAFPDVTNVQVMVLTEAPGQTPVDVEQQVTFPLELSLQGLPGVTQVRSLSKAGLSQVIVVFEDGTGIYFARQVVFERLQAARADLPAWAEPEMGPVSTGLGEVFQWTLESPTRTLMDLRTLQDWVVAPQLRALPGVTEVNTFGGFLKQYQVLVDPDLLLKYGVALREVEEAVARNNASAGGGYLVQGWEQAYVRSAGQAAGTNDLEAIVLKAVDGVPVRLGQVATVAIGHAARQGAVTRDGRGEAVAGMAIMLKGANARTVVDRIRAALPAVAASLPDDVRLNVFYDRITLIRACIRTVGDALLQGGFLVIVVLFLLLGNARAALITAAALPVSALLTFLAMGAAGLAANLMSLGGLAIAVGMLGDASIVVTENVARHMSKRHGSTGAELTAAAVAEVARPILFAGLTVIVVFLPILTLQGMEGRMFRPLAVTVCIALAASLFAAFTLIPALASGFLRPRAETREPRLTGALKRLYRPVLDRALRRPGVTLTASALLIAAAAALAPRVGTEFLPALDEGAIAINIVRLPTAALDGSVEVGTLIERRFLDAFPEIESIVTKTGRAEISEDPMGPEQNDVIIALKPPRTWTPGRTKAGLVAAMQEELAKIPGIRPSFSQPIALRVNELISGIKSDVAVKLFGPDLETLRDEANRIAVAIREIEGAEDVKVEQVSGFRQVEIVPDRAELARRGLNAGDVNEMVETAVGGRAVTRIAEGQRRFDAVVRFVADRRGDLDALRRLPLPRPRRVCRGRGAYDRSVRRRASGRLLGPPRRTVREPARGDAAPVGRRAGRARPDLRHAPGRARHRPARAAGLRGPPLRAGRRRADARRGGHRPQRAGGDRLHRALRHRGGQRRGAGDVHEPAPRLRGSAGRCGPPGLRPSLPAAADDRPDDAARPRPAGPRDRRGGGGATAPGRGRHRRPGHVDPADARRAAGALPRGRNAGDGPAAEQISRNDSVGSRVRAARVVNRSGRGK
jgi:cobalt-zinc-cadmium resistance protein CzcA